MSRNILQMLEQGPVLGDGGYIVELERRGLAEYGNLRPMVALQHPEGLWELYKEFVYAGSEVIQAMTFYADPRHFEDVDDYEEVNRAAVKLARQAAGDDIPIAGSLTHTFLFRQVPVDLGRIRAIFQDQVRLQREAGVDFFIGETFHRVDEAIICLEEIKKANVPAMITMTYKEYEGSEDGYSFADCAKALMDAGADIVGTNCMREPEEMLRIAGIMRDAVDGYVAVQSTAFHTGESKYMQGLKNYPYVWEQYQCTRMEMADYARKARDRGINFIGGCCGVEPYHIREMARALGKPVPGMPSHKPGR
jgi:betaine-homocysteine S-methyltransferase